MAIKAYLLVLTGTYVAVLSSNKVTNDVGVYGGDVISIEEAPFMAQFYSPHPEKKGYISICGGSIIHEKIILTAAHCLEDNTNANEYVVSLGTNHDDYKYKVNQLITSKNYYIPTCDYDLGLLELTETIIFTSKISKIDLADETFVLVNNMNLTAYGWGMTENGYRSDLRKVTVPYVDFYTCYEEYQELINQIPNYKLTSRMFCAGALGKGSCKGDSGAPIIFNNVQVGVTTKGAACGVFPGVYTKVSLRILRNQFLETFNSFSLN